MRRFDWVVLAVLAGAFLCTRSTAQEPIYFLAVDDPVYLGLAARLPGYSLYGQSGYVNHPPVFPLLIRIAASVVPLHVAGILVATVMQGLSAFPLWILGRRLGLRLAGLSVVFGVLLLNAQWQRLAGMAYKETTFVTLVLALLATWLLAAEGRRGTLAAAMVCATLLALTSDHVIFALPGCVAAVLLYARQFDRPKLRLCWPVVAGGVAYGAWLAYRLRVYGQGPEVPVGLGGMLEPTADIGLRPLFSPQALPRTAELTGVVTSWPSVAELRPLARALFDVWPLSWAARAGAVPGWMARGAAFAAGAASVAGLVWAAVSRRAPREAILARGLFVLVACMALAGSQLIVRATPRMFLVFPAVIALGLGYAITHAEHSRPWVRPLVCVTVGGAVLLGAGIGYRLMPVVTWFRQTQVEGQVAIDWLNKRPPAVLMAQVGYSPELAWQTQYTILGLPTDPTLLDEQVQEHDVAYLVYGTHYWQSPLDEPGRPVWNGETIAWIRAHPERYPLLATLQERYVYPLRTLPGDTLWVHGIASVGPN